MSIKIAVTYLISLFTNKLNIYISFLLSFLLQPILKILEKHISNEQVNLPILSITMLIFVAIILMTVEFIFSGIISKKNKKNISTNIGYFAGKLFSLMIYCVLAIILIFMLYDSMIALTIIFGPIILTILKEFTTIGENIQTLYGKKSYIFSIIDKLFGMLEFKYFKTIEDKEEDFINKNNSNG